MVTPNYSRLNRVTRDKWGIEVTYTPQGGAPRTVTAVINREYAEVLEVQTDAFVIKLADVDVPELAVGDAITALSVPYTVVKVQPDFFGMTDVVLNTA